MMSRTLRGALAVGLSSLFFASITLAADFPSEPIQINVCTPAGGGNDQNAQAIAPFVAKYLGQQAIIQYKPGAGGTLAATETARARPDGYNLLLCDLGGTVYGPIAQNLPLSGKDLIPIAQLTFVPWILTAGKDAPWADAQAFIGEAKAKPGKIDAAISDIASADHYAWLRFANEAGLGPAGLRWIPYGGGGPKVRAMLAGESKIDMLLPALIAEPSKTGVMRPFAVASDARLAAFPGVPTFKELGIDLTEGLAIHVFAPKGTPGEVVAKLREGFAKIKDDPEYRKVYANLGQDIGGFMDGSSYQAVWDQTWDVAPKLLRAAAGAR